MPLARIITKSADDSLELSMQLRSRGFRVETVAPDQIPNGPADLEVCLEECAPEEVLTKAAVVKESEDLWVFVAPGALDERARPMRVIPLVPQVDEFRIPEHLAAAVAEIKPKLEGSVVEVKAPAAELEDEPILSELAAQALTMSVPPPPQAEAVPSQIVSAAPVVVPAATQIPRVVEKPIVVEMPLAVNKSAVVPPPANKPVEIKKEVAAAPRSLDRIKHIAVTQHATEIPMVPERLEPKLFLYRPAPAKQKIRGPKKSYKVAFQSGPKLWRTASVTFALLVLAGLIATVVAVRPTIPAPATPKATTNVNPAVFLPGAQASTASSPSAVVSPSSPAAAHKVIAGKPSGPVAQRPAAPPHRSASDDGLIAKDTVVFYDHKPAPHQAKLPPPSDVKRYSD
ncbi:MAG TPA: hypothetical protein VLL05_07295 [Terriglobales bacterium]|nr:hypothetical protein [Terriglobales bacterium]